jgi:hypothetical protein
VSSAVVDRPGPKGCQRSLLAPVLAERVHHSGNALFAGLQPFSAFDLPHIFFLMSVGKPGPEFPRLPVAGNDLLEILGQFDPALPLIESSTSIITLTVSPVLHLAPCQRVAERKAVDRASDRNSSLAIEHRDHIKRRFQGRHFGTFLSDKLGLKLVLRHEGTPQSVRD